MIDTTTTQNHQTHVPAPTGSQLDDHQHAQRLDKSLDDANRLLDDAKKLEHTVALSVILPVYNEQTTLGEIVSRVAALPIYKEILIVDDGSTDGTSDVVQRLADKYDEVIALRHERNRGKGAALRTGIAAARGDVIVVQDADLEYDPVDILMLIKPVLARRCDVVFGSRYLAPVRQDHSWLHRGGNQLLTRLSNLFTGQKLSDMETCYKVFRRSVVQDIKICQNRFGVEPELTAKLSRRGLKIYELPISYNSRGYDEGKKIGIKDAFQAIWCIFRYGLAD